MQSSTAKQNQRQLTCPKLPLGVYREIAAHIRQVEGVDAGLIWRSLDSDRSESFDYYQSQVAALQITYAGGEDNARQQVEEILEYYAQRYSPWQDWNSQQSTA
jgi:hypothetical protein